MQDSKPRLLASHTVRSFCDDAARSCGFALAGLLVALMVISCSSPQASSSCRTVLNCPDSALPVCDSSTLSCRACVVGTDDVACKNRNSATPRCAAGGHCVGCLTSTDCKDLRAPVCGGNNTCGGCLKASDCASKICSADGSCAPLTDVTFVDNKNGTCQGTAHSGAMDDPYCSITDAITAVGTAGKSLINVEPTTQPYDPVNIATVGSAGLRLSSGSGVAGSIQIHSSGTIPALSVGAGGGNVVVSGFDLSSAGGNAIECKGGANLTVTASRVRDSTNGVQANSCTLTLDGVRIYNHRGVGVSLTNATYSLSNLMIWLNTVSGIALASSTGTLRFLTIYSNGSGSDMRPPGIDCGSGNNLVENSIVFGNLSRLGTNYTDYQMVGCNPTNVVTDDAKVGTVTSNIDFLTPTSADPGSYDLRLRADSPANATCCIDKATQGNLIDHDIDSNRRPQGAASDIGAHEAR